MEMKRGEFPMRSSRLLASVLCVLALFAPAALHSQVDRGTITGVIEDASNAVVPGAQVTVTNTDTGLVQQTASDASGVYTFPPLSIGHYVVTATAAGFQTARQENIQLNVQQRLEMDFHLQPGSVSQTVSVSTAPPLLQTEEGSLGQVMSATTISNTPLNGRNWIYIAQMAAGVDPANGSRGNGKGDFNANGQRAEQNNFVLDGVDNNVSAPDFLNGSSYAVQPPPDALEEFKVQTNSYNAEFGHSAGAVVNASVKSGTNRVHGNLWEYFRNDVLDARDFNALTIPKYRENQFGATLGFPVVRNKLFFFGYTEANRIVFGNTTTSTVPSPLMRQGNFTELLNPSLTEAGQAIKLYQPGVAGTPPLACNGQANVICPGKIDAVAQRILNLYPLPNANGGKLFNNYVNNSNTVDNTFQWGTRVDWNVSSKDQTFARFAYSNEPASYPPPLGPIIDSGTYGSDGQIVNRVENFAGSETHVFSPTTTNEFRFGYNYGNFAFFQVTHNDPALAASLGFGGIPTGQDNGGLPKTSVGGISDFGPPGFFPNHKGYNVYEILDNVQKNLGNHSLKVGVEFQSIRFSFLSPPAPRGTYGFTGLYTSIPGKSFTGYGVADFLLNSMQNATLSNERHFDDARWYRAAYAADTWTVSPRLTLDIGLRYEYFQPLRELTGAMANFNITGPIAPGSGQATLAYSTKQRNTYLAPKFTSLLAANNVAVQYSGNPYLVNPQHLDFAPRLGFAYKLDDKTALRGGYGLFYGGLENIGGQNLFNNYPFQFVSSFPNPSGCKPGNCPTNGITLETGFQQQVAQGLSSAVRTPNLFGTPAKVRTAYSQTYNLTVERAITNNIAATVAYAGSADRHLGVSYNSNSPDALIDPRLSTLAVEPFPSLGAITDFEYRGVSSYNSLQTVLEKRFDHGLNFLATYTWSHSLDDAPENLGSSNDSGYRNTNLIGIANDYSNSPFDVRHRVTFNGYYDLPFGHGRSFLNRSTLVSAVIGGWATDLQFMAQTGPPISIATDLGGAGPHGGGSNAILIRHPYKAGGTPDPSNPGVVCATKTRTLQHWYNPCAFANPPLAFPQAATPNSPISTTRYVGLAALPYLGGTRTSIYGPGFNRVNLSLFKDIPTFHEERLRFRADIFNTLNTPAYGAPSTANNSSTGGLITAPRFFQKLTPDARFVQLSLSYDF